MQSIQTASESLPETVPEMLPKALISLELNFAGTQRREVSLNSPNEAR